MPSHRDPRIDATFVQRLVSDQFPDWANLPVSPVAESGWDNHTFRLGEDMLVRLPSAAHYAAQVHKEQAWLPRLAAELPVSIPAPLACGGPALGFAWSWSVYGWIEGVTASTTDLADDAAFGADLARFLVALNRVDASGGPVAGRHNFHRGGALAVYDDQARRAVAAIDDPRLQSHAEAIWERALSSAWLGSPVWLHGDFAPLNILVRSGRLAAVIDWGAAGVGDPACDLAIAWTFLRSDARRAFAAGLPYDRQTWERGRGWALWKAMILATGVEPGPASETRKAWRTLETIIGTDIPA